MTHAVAWIAADTAYVIADALVTRSHGEIEDGETTFGERLDHGSGNAIVNESAVKVVRLSTNAVATLSANDAHAGLEALESLSVRVRAGASVEEALVEVQRLHPSDDFSLLVAAPSRSGTMSIFSLSGGKLSETYEDGAAVITGSAGPGLRSFTAATANAWSKDETLRRSPDRMLAHVLVALQAQGPRNSQIERGIGGTYFGLSASKGGVRYHDDLVFMLAEPREQSPIVMKRFVTSGWRGDLAFVRGFVARDGRVKAEKAGLFATKVNLISEEEAREIFETLTRTAQTPRFVAWVDTRTSAVLLFEQTSFANRLLGHVRFALDNQLDLGLAHVTEHILNSFPTFDNARKRGTVPFWFVSSVDDVQVLIDSGRWHPCAQCLAFLGEARAAR